MSRGAAPRSLTRQQAAALERRQQGKRRRLRAAIQKAGIALAFMVGAALLIYGYQLSGRERATSSPEMVSKPAPDFALKAVDGREVSLSEFRGTRNVLLFFNEGYGCAPCWQQTAALQQDLEKFQELDTEVFAVMVDSPALLAREAPRWGLRSLPILVDQSTAVSKSYNALGGMHANKPDHKFVLINKDGLILWGQDYPSMWVEPAFVVSQVRQLLEQ